LDSAQASIPTSISSRALFELQFQLEGKRQVPIRARAPATTSVSARASFEIQLQLRFELDLQLRAFVLARASIPTSPSSTAASV
jgi:hypothetical protein